MTHEEIKAMSASEVAECLIEHQKWRRGEPPYPFGADNDLFTPRELGAIIDCAIELLKEVHKRTKTEYLIQRDYGTRRKHLWMNWSIVCNYGNAKSCIEKSANRGKLRLLKREVTDWEVVYNVR